MTLNLFGYAMGEFLGGWDFLERFLILLRAFCCPMRWKNNGFLQSSSTPPWECEELNLFPSSSLAHAINSGKSLECDATCWRCPQCDTWLDTGRINEIFPLRFGYSTPLKIIVLKRNARRKEHNEAYSVNVEGVGGKNCVKKIVSIKFYSR